MKCNLILSAALVAILASAQASAATNLVVNGGFELLNSNAVTGQYHICDNTKTTCQSTVSGWSATASPKGPRGTNSPGSVLLSGNGGAEWNSGFKFWGSVPDSPLGGNFLAIDGDTNYAQSIFQTLSGLTIGKSYTLTFYQAAAQQRGLNGATTNRWEVSFGGETQLSTLMPNPSRGIQPWALETMTFTPTAASQILKFVAAGTPNGLPPVSLIDGVSLTEAVPEPASWAMLIIGFGLVGAAARRRRNAVTA